MQSSDLDALEQRTYRTTVQHGLSDLRLAAVVSLASALRQRCSLLRFVRSSPVAS